MTDHASVYRKLWYAARRAGLGISRDQVARLMAIAVITGAIRGRHRTTTTRRDHTAPRYPDLVKRGWDTPTAPDELWVADFSYVWTLAGFCYVAFVVDVFSRRILGWRVSTSKETSLVLDAFRQALDTRHRADAQWTTTGFVHHSDAGSQYTSVAFTAELLTAGILGSIGTVGDALDNALCESTIGLFKTGAINNGGLAWKTRAEVEWQVARWVHWYNTTRLHSSIGHLPPIEFEQQHRQAKDDVRPGGRLNNHPPAKPGRFTPMPVAPVPLPDVRFFVDADLLGVGKAFAVVRKDVVHPGHRGCPEIQPETPDSVWLPIVGNAGWISIGRNKRIRYNPVENRPLRQHGSERSS